MTENGDPCENVITERVNGILKTELINPYYENVDEASRQLPGASLFIIIAEGMAASTGKYQTTFISNRGLK